MTQLRVYINPLLLGPPSHPTHLGHHRVPSSLGEGSLEFQVKILESGMGMRVEHNTRKQKFESFPRRPVAGMIPRSRETCQELFFQGTCEDNTIFIVILRCYLPLAQCWHCAVKKAMVSRHSCGLSKNQTRPQVAPNWIPNVFFTTTYPQLGQRWGQPVSV